MMTKKSYTGIDCFRLIAALLIVAIHTSPLVSFSETGDFILTRAAARIAVPFFFTTSGFFLISRYAYNTERLISFIKKTAALYGTAILLYVPVNIYNDYFKMNNLLPNIIKDIVFDGTLYHLWYLPAAMAGAAVAWYLVRRLDYPKAFAAASLLYLIGLFGDSYYGISEKIPCLNGMYQLIFQITDYTRNGIFFAPIFFIIGGFAADSGSRLSLKKGLTGFVICFTAMLGEALTLHFFKLQRHDSMYIFLVPCTYFLFQAILYFKGRRLSGIRMTALTIYIVHPMAIIMLRLLAKLLRRQSGMMGQAAELLVENSIIRYLSVCVVSAGIGIIVTAIRKKYNKGYSIRYSKKYNKEDGKKYNVKCGKRSILDKNRRNCEDRKDRTYLEINLDNLAHNAAVLKKAMPKGCELMAVVKADAYGHGMYEIAVHLNRLGVSAFAVATIDEGIALRRYGISGEILILGYTEPTRAKELHKYELTQTLIDYEYSILLENQGVRVNSQIKIDTGMHRLGFDSRDIEKIENVFAMKHIKVNGIYTHLCVCDSLEADDVCFTYRQIDDFYNIIDQLEEKGIPVPKIHIQSSYGLLNYPELPCDYVRAGIALYGVLSSPNDKTRLQPGLKPVLSLKTKIVLIREVRQGESVGYGRTFISDKNRIIAILPVGYADGYPRSLSCGKGYVLISGYRAPVVGRVCMDQMAVDVTGIPGVCRGMTATLIGTDGKEEISAPMLAEYSESIANELLSRMGKRVKVVVSEGL